jgi:proline iminopeptidase
MVQSAAKTVKQYLDELPEEKRGAISKVRSVVKKNLPKGYRETMSYGMITYEIPLASYPDTYNKQPLCYAGLAAQKNFNTLYLMDCYADPKQRKRLEDAFRKSSKKMDMGKSCLHFQSPDDLPLDAIGEIIASTPPEKMIEVYEAGRGKRGWTATKRAGAAKKRGGAAKKRAGRAMVIALMAMLAGCAREASESMTETTALEPGEGMVEVAGGKVWYRVVGEGTATPAILLHGGPGAPSYYLKPLLALGDERPVVIYDQLGAGRSDHVTDTTLFTIDRFVDELETLRAHLGIERFHLYGNSWGSILAVEYYLRHPEGVESLVLSGPALSIPMWLHAADSLVATLPESSRMAIERNEAAGTFDAPEYQAAMMEFYGMYLARRQPWSADIDSTFAQLGLPVYNYMWGPSEFTATGTLQQYDVTGRLGEIRVPTLFVVGEHDEATPAAARHYQSLVPGAEIAVIPGAAHLSMQDEPELELQAIREFLSRVEARAELAR